MVRRLFFLIAFALTSRAPAQDWSLMPVPGSWEEHADQQFKDHDGFAWYRCFVKVPAKWTNLDGRPLWYESVTLSVSDIGDAHEVFVNGLKIGSAGKMPPEFKDGRAEFRRYKIPPGSLKTDQYNTIAIRVYDAGDQGGFLGKAPIMAGYFTECVLQGDWEFRIGDDSDWATDANSDRPADAVFDSFDISSSTLETPDQFVPGERTPPARSIASMTVADDLQIDLVLSEPQIAQALSMNFDERGRLWLSEYRQYPYPAGVKMVSRDKYYRAAYDKPLHAPPNHNRGADRISIHTDTNGDGTFDQSKTFVDGLNIATSALKDHDGVWVLNPPYLLFYPDTDQDDVPDGPPEVHLHGFGLSDTHSTANSLHFGPDGWVYGMQGSSIVSHIKVGPRRQAEDRTSRQNRSDGENADGAYCEGPALWRYHRPTKRFEFFAEGGGNAFGIEIDSKGRFFSGHNGANTRGFYYQQGGYYQKGTEVKYGGTSNPYAFGMLPHMPHGPIPRFSHTFVKYESEGLPSAYQGKLLSVDPLHRNVVLSSITPHGSTFKTADISVPLQSDAITFRPVDIRVGPDGAVYIADFCEQFIAHGQHFQGMLDRESGRVYRLRAKDAPATLLADYSDLSTANLVERLRHPSKWHRQTALRLLGNRQAQSVASTLKGMINENGQVALEALWASNLLGHLDDPLTAQTLRHPNPHVRRWTVRLLGDRGSVSPLISKQLIRISKTEPDAEVRAQLSASARRLPAEVCLPIVQNLSRHNQDANDDVIPLMLWWALESKVESDTADVLGLFESKDFWTRPLVASALVARIMRRFASSGKRNDLLHCATLLKTAPDAESKSRLMTGFEEAFRGRSLASLPVDLASELASAGGGSLALRIRVGDQASIKQALQTLVDNGSDLQTRIELAEVLGEIEAPRCTTALLSVVESTTEPNLQNAAITSLQKSTDNRVATAILRLYPGLTPSVREVAQTLFASRKPWSKMMLDAIDRGDVDSDSISTITIRKITIHQDDQIKVLLDKHFGDIRGATNAEMADRIQTLASLLRDQSGDVYEGKALYAESCGKCHKLYREGGNIGPDLTQYKRDDVLRMLLHIVNPNAEVREGFETHLILTDDGRAVTGFLADQDNQVVIIRGSDGQEITIERDAIEIMKRQATSLMPEGLLDKMTKQQIVDLFAYLRASQPIFK